MYKKLFGETVIYGLGAVLPRLINFLLTRLFTVSIEEAEFSIFANLYAAVSILNVILSFGFETSYFRFNQDFKERKVFHTTNIFLIGNVVFFLILVYTFLNPIAVFSHYENQKEYLLWFAWIIGLDTLCVIPFAWLRFHNKPVVFTTIKLANMFISLSFTLVLLTFYKDEIVHFAGFTLKQNVSFPFFANLVASFFTVILLLPILLKIRWELDRSLLKKMIHYSLPIMLAGLAFTINENFDKLIQRTYISESEAGSYGACYKLAALMTIFVTAFRMGVEPFLFKQMKNENAPTTYATILDFFILVSCGIMLGILGNISWIQNIFIRTEGYKLAMGIVPIIIIANLFYGVYHNLSVWYKVSDKTYYGTYVSWVGAIITLLINLLLLKSYGFMVSAWGTLAAYGSMMVISYYLGQKKYPIPYKYKKVVFYMGVAITLVLINYYGLHQNVISGNIFFLLFMGMVYYLEKDHLLKGIFK